MPGSDQSSQDSLAIQAAPPGSPPLLTAMTGIRAIMCLWVVFYHLRDIVYLLLPGTRVLEWLIDGGYLTIDVFFMLSGFIIAYNYAPKLARATSGERRDYLVARVARIYPVHAFALLLTLALVGVAAYRGGTLNANQDYDVLGFLGNLFMLQAFPGVQLWNIPSWSVCCEMIAYLAFPMGAALLLRAGRRTAWLLAVALLMAQAGLMAAFWETPYVLYAMFWVRIVTEFSAGALLWAGWRHAPIVGRRCDLVVVGAAVAFLVVLGVRVPAPWSFLAVPLLALGIVATAGVTGVVHSVFTTRGLQWGGLASYSIYLVHIPVYQAMLQLYRPRAFVDASLAVRIAVVMSYPVAMIIGGGLVFHLVEEPARRWVRRHLSPLAAAWRARPANPTERIEGGKPDPATVASSPDTANGAAQSAR